MDEIIKKEIDEIIENIKLKTYDYVIAKNSKNKEYRNELAIRNDYINTLVKFTNSL